MNTLHTRYFIACDPHYSSNYLEGSVDILESGNQFMWDVHCNNWNHNFFDKRYSTPEEAIENLELALHESFDFWCYIQPAELVCPGYPYN